jgi:hypothetical protein
LTDIANPFRNRAAAVAQNIEAEARANALTTIGRASIVLIFLGLLDVVIIGIRWGNGVGLANLLDATIVLGCGIAIRTHRSRFLAAALLLISLSDIASFFAFGNRSFGIVPGFLPLLATFFAVKGTVQLGQIEGLRLVWKGVALNVLAFAIYEILAFAIAFFALGTFSPETENVEISGLIIYGIFLAILVLVCLQYLPFTRRATNISRSQA